MQSGPNIMCSKSEVFRTEDGTLDKVLEIFEKSKASFDTDVANLRQWMENQPHLPEVLETKAIENFLLMNKCSYERTKEKLDMYYTVRSKLPDIYDEINPRLTHLKNLTNIMYLTVHPQLTDNFYRVSFVKIHNKKLAESWHPIDLVRFVINLQELKIREDVVFGDIVIFDCDGITFNQQLKISPTLMYKALNIIYKKVFNFRLKAMYFLNMPSYGERVLGVIKTVLKPKIFKRFHICRDSSLLKEHLPIELIPANYGGKGPCLNELQDALNAKFFQEQDLFDRLDKIRVDEKCRPEKLNDDFLGIYGDFKKLDLD